MKPPITLILALVPVLIMLASAAAQAAIHTETLEYKSGDAMLKGYLAYDDAMTGKRPAVLVAPEWWGLNDYAKMRAGEIAKLGYLALAIDIYSDGKTAANSDEAGRLSGAFRQDKALLRQRARAAFDVVAKHPLVDPSRIAATGYCFGGTTALELAYSGADLKGVAAFHAGLTVPDLSEAQGIKAKILILHGADDTFESAEDITLFQEAMRAGALDWQMIYFGGAVHSFTNPAAGGAGMGGVAYNEKADKRSWRYMKDFLAEIFS